MAKPSKKYDGLTKEQKKFLKKMLGIKILEDLDVAILKQLKEKNCRIVFGSDAHNTDSRCPNWDMILEECDSELLVSSNELLEIKV